MAEFREVRRNKKQILPQEESIEILNKQTNGVICFKGDNEYPYGVPMSYAYYDGKIYLHGMYQGHKVDCLNADDHVCFTIVETDQIVAEEYTTYFRSVMAFGKIRISEDHEERLLGHAKLVEKYSPEHIITDPEEIEKLIKPMAVFVIDVEHISGKEAIEFAEAREK